MDILITYILGACLVCNGIVQIISAFTEKKTNKNKAVMVVCGILSVLVGVYSLLHPFLTMVSIGVLIAMTLVMQGISMVTSVLANDSPDEEIAQ